MNHSPAATLLRYPDEEEATASVSTSFSASASERVIGIKLMTADELQCRFAVKNDGKDTNQALSFVQSNGCVLCLGASCTTPLRAPPEFHVAILGRIRVPAGFDFISACGRIVAPLAHHSPANAHSGRPCCMQVCRVQSAILQEAGWTFRVRAFLAWITLNAEMRLPSGASDERRVRVGARSNTAGSTPVARTTPC